jgi:hypothetical protein
MKRIWLDTVVASMLSKEDFEQVIYNGDTLIIANTVIDVKVFQDNIDWFESRLQDSSIIIEIWNTPNEMVQKHFFWSSCQLATESADDLETAVQSLPNGEAILKVAILVDYYGIPKGSWKMGAWAPPAPLSAEIAEALEIDPATVNRSDVMTAAQRKGRMDLFDEYNVGYNKGLAKQHMCDAILNSDGTYTNI